MTCPSEDAERSSAARLFAEGIRVNVERCQKPGKRQPFRRLQHVWRFRFQKIQNKPISRQQVSTLAQQHDYMK
jgi:hypothetical protein